MYHFNYIIIKTTTISFFLNQGKTKKAKTVEQQEIKEVFLSGCGHGSTYTVRRDQSHGK
jgi:hypothetical protein